jgi:hypothetical protein
MATEDYDSDDFFDPLDPDNPDKFWGGLSKRKLIDAIALSVNPFKRDGFIDAYEEFIQKQDMNLFPNDDDILKFESIWGKDLSRSFKYILRLHLKGYCPIRLPFDVYLIMYQDTDLQGQYIWTCGSMTTNCDHPDAYRYEGCFLQLSKESESYIPTDEEVAQYVTTCFYNMKYCDVGKEFTGDIITFFPDDFKKMLLDFFLENRMPCDKNVESFEVILSFCEGKYSSETLVKIKDYLMMIFNHFYLQSW